MPTALPCPAVIPTTPEFPIHPITLNHLCATLRADGHPRAAFRIQAHLKATSSAHLHLAFRAAALFVSAQGKLITSIKQSMLALSRHHCAGFAFYALDQLEQLLGQRGIELTQRHWIVIFEQLHHKGRRHCHIDHQIHSVFGPC